MPRLLLLLSCLSPALPLAATGLIPQTVVAGESPVRLAVDVPGAVDTVSVQVPGTETPRPLPEKTVAEVSPPYWSHVNGSPLTVVLPGQPEPGGGRLVVRTAEGADAILSFTVAPDPEGTLSAMRHEPARLFTSEPDPRLLLHGSGFTLNTVATVGGEPLPVLRSAPFKGTLLLRLPESIARTPGAYTVELSDPHRTNTARHRFVVEGALGVTSVEPALVEAGNWPEVLTVQTRGAAVSSAQVRFVPEGATPGVHPAAPPPVEIDRRKIPGQHSPAGTVGQTRERPLATGWQLASIETDGDTVILTLPDHLPQDTPGILQIQLASRHGPAETSVQVLGTD